MGTNEKIIIKFDDKEYKLRGTMVSQNSIYPFDEKPTYQNKYILTLELWTDRKDKKKRKMLKSKINFAHYDSQISKHKLSKKEKLEALLFFLLNAKSVMGLNYQKYMEIFSYPRSKYTRRIYNDCKSALKKIRKIGINEENIDSLIVYLLALIRCEEGGLI